MIKLLTFLLLLLTTITVSGQLVTKVYDGDTFYAKGYKKRIRFSDLDSPELNQLFGKDAKKYTESLILNKVVRVVPVTTDKYKRIIAQVYVGDRWINKAVVDAGYAWAYKGLSILHDAQIQARKAKKGIWQVNYNQPPFKYRH